MAPLFPSSSACAVRSDAQRPRAIGRRLVVGAALLLLVAACGGGGGGNVYIASIPVEPPPDGITGTVRAPDQLLGRIAEREPNATEAQPFRLPPVFARCRLEVAGNLGVTAGLYGESDPVDVLRFLSLDAADVTLTLDYAAVDDVGGGPNAFEVEVRTTGAVTLLTLSGATPLTGTFPLAARQAVFVHVRAVQGHGPWVLSLQSADPPTLPKPGTVAGELERAATAPTVNAAAANLPTDDACSSEHVLVRLKDGVDAAAWAAARGYTLGGRTGSGTWRMRLPAGGTEPALARAKRSAAVASSDPEVVFSEPDWIVKPCGTAADPDFPRQWNLRAIGATDAWDATRGAASIVIGVVDTGVVADHPDLQGQLLPGYDFISNPDSALDGDGRDPDPTDFGDAALASGLSSWHGSHVAAIIVGRADTGGVVGVAPACRVLPLRALGKGGGLSSDVADAILFAAGQLTTSDGQRLTEPVRVLNLSLGSPAPSSEVEAACAVALNLGVLVIAAAGNDGGAVTYPAAFPSVLAVGAVDGLLDGTAYSNHGPQVSLCAPGGTSVRDRQGDGWPDSILSAVIDQTQYPRATASGCLQGTSQAAPHVAGAAALLLSLDSTLTPTQVRTRLQDSALDRGAVGYDTLHGFGLVQAGTAVKRLLLEQGQPVGPPALHLPTPTLRFTGLESVRSVPLTNRGGGTLLVLGAQATTDDGLPWLSAVLIPNLPGADCTASRAEIIVDRLVLPQTPGWWSGTIRLYGLTESLGLIRVTVSTVLWPRAGSPFRVIALDDVQLGVRADGHAHPQNDYRYWFRGLAPMTYLVKAGDDLDFDGFFCEPNDLCGWHGGDSQATATPLVLLPGTAFTNTDVIVR